MCRTQAGRAWPMLSNPARDGTSHCGRECETDTPDPALLPGMQTVQTVAPNASPADLGVAPCTSTSYRLARWRRYASEESTLLRER